MEPLQLSLVLHFHQPIGNLDPVFNHAFKQCYEPLLTTIEEAGELTFTLHFTGPLLEWLENNQTGYLERLRQLTAAGRIEWLSGGFYEPILAAIPPPDRLGQLLMMRHWLEDNMDFSPSGCWLAERVWEPALVSILAEAGLDYTLVDDHLPRRAGFPDPRERHPYIMEDGGQLLHILPISERLRYLIPFHPIEELEAEIDEHLEHGGRFLIYGDDAEKFGLWPRTHDLVYGEEWLKHAWQALARASDRVQTCRTADLLHKCGPSEPAFIPAGSYREMEEWATPYRNSTLTDSPVELEPESTAEKVDCGKPSTPSPGNCSWRQFFIRYPEGRRIHGRICAISRLLNRIGPTANEALKFIYRAQCNCAFWHGQFGGIYLTHLRDGLYRNLLEAERVVLSTLDRKQETAQREAQDFDLDGHMEIALTNTPIRAIVKPNQGGRLLELSHLEKAWNPLLAFARRKESYHQQPSSGEKATLPNHLDQTPRDCFLDRIVTHVPPAEEWLEKDPEMAGDLSTRTYSESWDGDTLVLSCPITPNEDDSPRLTKRIEITTRGLHVSYQLTRTDAQLLPGWLAVECSLGPGNLGGDSCIEADNDQHSVATPFALPAPPQITVQGITRGDVHLHQHGADQIICSPIWSISRDETATNRNLQGTSITIFIPLQRLINKDCEPTIDLLLEPWD